MDRKKFLKSIGLASGCVLLFPGSRAQAAADGKPQEGTMDHRQRFKEAWLTSLMENLEERFSGEERTRLMEECGRDCARRSSVHKTAESCEGDVSKLVNTLARFLGQENCVLENNHVLLRYGKCYCELVDKGPERLPATYCLCSRGWVVEMFETAAQKPVTVDVIKTIKRGDPFCEFSISI